MWKILKRIKKGDYHYALVPNHPNSTKNGYVLYHRVVVENRIGRLLTNEEVVHHINGDKHDNRECNLEVFHRGRHAQLHHPKKNNVIHSICPECQKKFSYPFNQRPSVKGQKRKFCSRSCNGKFNRREYLKKRS